MIFQVKVNTGSAIFVYEAIAKNSCDAVNAALDFFGVCSVFVNAINQKNKGVM